MNEQKRGDEVSGEVRDDGSPNDAGGFTRRELLRASVRAAAAAGLMSGAVSFLASGCGRRQAGLRPELVRGSLRTALEVDVETLDPAMHRSRTVEAVVRNICDGLVARDAEMRYLPQLAVSWRVEGDTRWVFKLRDGVRFHSGDPFTAEDVKFTIDRIIGAIPGLSPSPRKDLLGPVAGAEVIDKRTVAVVTDGRQV